MNDMTGVMYEKSEVKNEKAGWGNAWELEKSEVMNEKTGVMNELAGVMNEKTGVMNEKTGVMNE